MMRPIMKVAAQPPDHATARLRLLLQQLADDPDQVDANLRGALREAVRVMATQDEVVAVLRRHLRRGAIMHGVLAGAWFAMAAYQIARLFHWL